MNYPFFQLDNRVLSASEQVMQRLEPVLRRIGQVTGYDQQGMPAALNRTRVSESHLVGTIGYGYDDRDRDVLDKIYAYVLGMEGVLMRINFVNGTRVFTVALFGVLRPGDMVLNVTGIPYDTLRGVLRITGNSNGSLKEFGTKYEQLGLKEDGTPDYEEMRHRVHPDLRTVYIQRSHGYDLRLSLFVENIERIAEIAKCRAPGYIVIVGNCYDESV